MKNQTADFELVRAATQEFYKGCLYSTAKYLCGYKDINWRTHGDCIMALQDATSRKLVVMPRGTFKTSLCVVAYSIWLMIRDPNIRILIDSELWTLSKNSLREIKDHIRGDAFQAVFPGWKLTLDNQSEMIISTRTKAKKEPTITSSGMGAGKTGSHYDAILADDLNSPINSVKPELADQVINHYRYYTSLLDPGGLIAVMGTRYSELDLIGHIIKNEIGDGIRSQTST